MLADDNAPMAVNNEVIVLEGGGGGTDPISEMPPTIGELEEEELVEDGFEHQGPPGDEPLGGPNQDEMGVRHCFYDFCKQTILHGWHYLADVENENAAPPTPTFVTGFSPVGSPNNTLAGKIF